MTLRHADERIELPEPPLHATSEEGSLRGAEVVACLLSGNKLRGQLLQLSVANQLVTMQLPHSTISTDIPFAELRYLVFTRHNPVSSSTDLLPSAINTVDSLQSFRLTFVDGKTLSGQSRGHVADDACLHLFKAIDAASVIRIFIPHLNIKDYRIGPLIWEALEQHPPAQNLPHGSLPGEAGITFSCYAVRMENVRGYRNGYH